MSTIYRKILICLAAVFAMSAVAVTAASAATPPEFRHKGAEVKLRKFKSTTKAATLDAAGTIVTCASSSTAAGAEIVAGAEQKKVTDVVVVFAKCKSENAAKEKCAVHSKGKVEEIETEKLSGELGKVAKAEAADEVGLALKPTTGKIFVTLEGTCLPITPSPVEGSVIGEPTLKLALKGELTYATEAEKQKIQMCSGNLTGFCNATKDTLEVFKIAEATEATTATNTFEETVEVT